MHQPKSLIYIKNIPTVYQGVFKLVAYGRKIIVEIKKVVLLSKGLKIGVMHLSRMHPKGF